MYQFVVDLRISSEQYLKHYSGSASTVRVKARDGRRIQFPASRLRGFVSRDGVSGTFVLTVDDNFKLHDFRRL